MIRTILVFKHMPSQNPGVFREFAVRRDVVFQEIDLHAGDEVPDLDRFDALWVMGGSMQVWEEYLYPWLVREKQIIREVIRNDVMPFLGVCLGHQLAADALGGQTALAEHAEIGIFPVEPSVLGRLHPLMQGLELAHGWTNVHTAEVTVLPDGAAVLASSELCKNNILQLGPRAYSCQFHPEVCEHTMSGWMEIPGIPEFLQQNLGSDSTKKFADDVQRKLPELNKNSERLFDNWLDLVFD
ncbi:MAG: type 1 glutamine amidotransferase [Pseudomonadota bacterium]